MGMAAELPRSPGRPGADARAVVGGARLHLPGQSGRGPGNGRRCARRTPPAAARLAPRAEAGRARRHRGRTDRADAHPRRPDDGGPVRGRGGRRAARDGRGRGTVGAHGARGAASRRGGTPAAAGAGRRGHCPAAVRGRARRDRADPEAAEEARAVGTTVRAALADVDSGMMPPNFGPLERRNLTDADLARLQAVKASHDPRGTIRSARPIPLPHRRAEVDHLAERQHSSRQCTASTIASRSRMTSAGAGCAGRRTRRAGCRRRRRP